MNPKLAVVVNGEKVLEYDRSKRLPGVQRRFLDEMDTKMLHEGIKLGEEQIAIPDALQRAQFVANLLIGALLDENDALATASCSYLALRLEKLQQVRAVVEGNAHKIQFSFDLSYEQSQQEKPLTFTPIGSSRP